MYLITVSNDGIHLTAFRAAGDAEDVGLADTDK